MSRGISIIIPCLNAGTFLLDSVYSVIKQPFRYDYEVIVVDDGSDDVSTQLALDKIEQEPTVKVIRKAENCGAQFARNSGIMLSSYNYILTIDADDCLNTDPKILKNGTYTDRAIEILEARPDIAFVHSISCMFDNYDGYTISAYPVTTELILNKHHAQTSIVYRKDDALNASLYNLSISKWQDWSFAVSILNARFKQNKENNIFFFETPYYLYRVHNNPIRISSKNICERKMTKITIEQNVEIFNHHFPNKTVDEITKLVLSKKPDKLTDLLYIASNNIETALQISKQRGYSLTSDVEPKNIP